MRLAGDIPGLIRHLDHPDPTIQWRAAEALGACGEAAVPPLIRALNSRSLPARLGAIEALGAIRDPRAIGPLADILNNDRSLELRWSAIIALGETGSVDVIPVIHPLLRDPNRFLRYGAAIALARAGWHPENETDTVYLLIARQDWDGIRKFGAGALPALWDMLRDADEETRVQLMSLIGQTGDPRACGACQKSLKDRNPRVRWRAVLASMDCGLAPHDLPIMVGGRERTGPDPAAAAILNFLFLGIGYNYIGKWWGFPVFLVYMFIVTNAQFALASLSIPPILALVIAYPVTALLGIHTYFMAERMSDNGM